VTVPGRTDIGRVVEECVPFGLGLRIECVGVYFPDTGECAYYDSRRVATAAVPPRYGCPKDDDPSA